MSQFSKAQIIDFFKTYLSINDISVGSAGNYRAGINRISEHLGEDIFDIYDLQRLSSLIDDYGTQGRFSEVGNAYNGSARAGLIKWANFQKALQEAIEREKSLGLFLEKWPVEKLKNLSLEQYSAAGTRESFCYDLEFGLAKELGSMRGGNSTKFGIYQRANDKPTNAKGFTRDEQYSWREKYGASADEAFATIKQRILSVIDLAHAGNAQGIEALELEPWLKWKIAFLYQNQQQPVCLAIYSMKMLHAIAKPVDNNASYFSLYQTLLALRGEMPPLAYSQLLWQKHNQDNSKSDADELDDDDMESELQSDLVKPPLNQILFGPPGTGKTYHTINHALKVLAPELFDKDGNELVAREKLKEAFDQFVKEGRIAFVTFHQSFSYEDFVEGIRAVTDSDDESETSRGVRYEVAAGVFLQLCEKARSNPVQNADLGISEHARVWKISIGEANGEQQTRQYCFDNDQARIGWDNVGDLRSAKLDDPKFNLGSNDKSSMRQFSKDMQIGDIVLCFKSVSSICAVGVVSGEYFFEESTPSVVRDDYTNVLPVKWLAKNIDFNILPLNNNVRLTMKTVYPLPRITWPKLNAALADANIALGGQVQLDSGGQDCVLIIDEINRGNISRIFGELISLIEPSKRQGAAEALSVTLPYSKEKFSVPNNLYIIGTMNTADRSLTGIDIALRRRFEFIEMPPRPELLKGVTVEGVDIDIEALLTVLNARIEALIGRDYCLGHAYFMPLKTERTLAKLAQIFQKQILPLLQEYFFDDWQRIALVFNDHRKSEELRFVQQQGSSVEQLFGDVEGLGELAPRWRINHAAFNKIESYRALIGQPFKSDAATEPAASAQPASAPNATTATQQPAVEPEAVAGAEGAM